VANVCVCVCLCTASSAWLLRGACRSLTDCSLIGLVFLNVAFSSCCEQADLIAKIN